MGEFGGPIKRNISRIWRRLPGKLESKLSKLMASVNKRSFDREGGWSHIFRISRVPFEGVADEDRVVLLVICGDDGVPSSFPIFRDSLRSHMIHFLPPAYPWMLYNFREPFKLKSEVDGKGWSFQNTLCTKVKDDRACVPNKNKRQ